MSKANAAITRLQVHAEKRFLEETVECAKIPDLLRAKYIDESKVDVMQMYYVLMQKTQGREIHQAKWTQEMISENVDPLILEAVSEYATQNSLKSVSDIGRQFQVAQQCYEDMTRRKKNPLKWNASIGKKISLSNFHKTLIERYLARETLEGKI
ncbi:unnamed protein product [Thelazia callipaeda]|uniref:Phage protein n=1 Tax=Thelazia callipaeda TaxID=103827 RepID=A0A0N5D7D5_THECL|nr:unnamed protein product [Thelazia callipaeda]